MVIKVMYMDPPMMLFPSNFDKNTIRVKRKQYDMYVIVTARTSIMMQFMSIVSMGG